MNPFRRNFIIAAIVHVAFVGGLVAWELFAPKLSHSVPAPVEIVVPADILGNLPKGPGVGRGAYAPPAPTPVPSPAPAMPTGAADETPAPAPTPTPSVPVRSTPDQVSISRKPSTPPVKKPTTATTKTGSTTKVVSATPTGAASAEQIRQRFLKAAGNGEAGGMPYGDGRSAGGGSGNGKIGSPDGSPNGVVGGVGAGSPNWEYYQHVHDRMYEAWEQPGSLNDKKLATTVLLKVGRDGKIEGASVYRSSGSKLMDDSALSAARKVGLLEPPPAALLKGTEAPITIVFQVEG